MLARLRSATAHRPLAKAANILSDHLLYNFSTESAETAVPDAAQVGKLSHVAIAVPDLQAAARKYSQAFGAKVSSPKDLPDHGVTVVFVDLPNTQIELLHPLGQASPIAKFLKRNPQGGIHHICLQVGDVQQAIDHVGEHSIRALDKKPKIGGHGNPVVFLHPKDNNGVLVELEQAH